MRILKKQEPLTLIYQFYCTFNTLPIHLLYNQKYWNWYIAQCFMFVITEVYRNYFTANKSMHSYDTRQSNDLHIQ